MTKAAQILELYAQGLPTTAIAEIVGTSDSYVRVVARQRRGTVSENDRRYQQSELGRLTRQRRHKERKETDPEYRERRRAHSNAWSKQNRAKRRDYLRNRYLNDPVYRAKKLEMMRVYRARHRASDEARA